MCRVVDAQHPAIAGAIDDVRAVEARRADVRAGSGARAAKRRTERVGGILDDQQIVRGGDFREAVPVGQIADQRRHHHRLGVGPDHRLDLPGIDVECVRLDVDERRHQPVLDQRRNGGGEGQRRRDDLGSMRQPEQLDGEIIGARARVDHDSVTFWRIGRRPTLPSSGRSRPSA